MKNLKAKLRRDGGFTLVEMLIVVAIIAILVAVSIPMVGTALDKARDATDKANLRAAKAEALILYMNDQMDGKPNTTIQDGWYYDINLDTFAAAAPAGYNQGKLGAANKDAKTEVIQVKITEGVANPIEVKWVARPSNPSN